MYQRIWVDNIGKWCNTIEIDINIIFERNLFAIVIYLEKLKATLLLIYMLWTKLSFSDTIFRVYVFFAKRELRDPTDYRFIAILFFLKCN